MRLHGLAVPPTSASFWAMCSPMPCPPPSSTSPWGSAPRFCRYTGLSFVGLGVQPPTPEWGSILASGRTYMRNFWPMFVFPGIAIVVTLILFNLVGDGLRDAMDPKLKR